MIMKWLFCFSSQSFQVSYFGESSDFFSNEKEICHLPSINFSADNVSFQKDVGGKSNCPKEGGLEVGRMKKTSMGDVCP